LFTVPAQPDLFPDIQLLLVIINEPVHDFFLRSSAPYTRSVNIVPADQFAWTCYCHGLVFSAEQMKPGVVQARQR
jgi:hypothetical protein